MATLKLQSFYTISFFELFQEAPHPFEVYLKDLSSIGVFEFLRSLNDIRDLDEVQGNLVSTLIQKEDVILGMQIMGRVRQIEKNGFTASVFSRHTTLSLMEYLLASHKDELFDAEIRYDSAKAKAEFHSLITKGQGINLLKGYVALATGRIDKLKTAKEYVRTKYIGDNATLLFAREQICSRLEEFELSGEDSSRELIAQLIKSYWFFKLLEQSKKYQDLIFKVLSNKNLNRWEDYVLKLFLFNEEFLKPGINRVRIRSGSTKVSDIEFFDNFCFVGRYLKKDNDNFMQLRTSPFYKLDPDCYSSLFSKFAVQKIYHSAFIEIADIAKGMHINLKSELGKSFFEDYLFDIQMEHMCSRLHGVRVSGRLFGRIDGAPDHYLRIGNSVLIFECKDMWLKKEIKASYNWDQIEGELKEKLILNKKGRDKAMRQLLKAIKSLPSYIERFDAKFKSQRVRYYPVIVTQERVLDTTGINHVLNHWFLELRDQILGPIMTVKPLTIINIDTLIIYSDHFRENINSLPKLIDDYQEGAKAGKERGLYSFHTWIKRTVKLTRHTDMDSKICELQKVAEISNHESGEG